jgi:hypothetical protein
LIGLPSVVTLTCTTACRHVACAAAVLGNGEVLWANTVIITAGTFLRGVIYRGRETYAAGRHKRTDSGSETDEIEPPSVGLALTFERLGFPLNRLATGTPARLAADSLSFEGMEVGASAGARFLLLARRCCLRAVAGVRLHSLSIAPLARCALSRLLSLPLAPSRATLSPAVAGAVVGLLANG